MEITIGFPIRIMGAVAWDNNHQNAVLLQHPPHFADLLRRVFDMFDTVIGNHSVERVVRIFVDCGVNRQTPRPRGFGSVRIDFHTIFPTQDSEQSTITASEIENFHPVFQIGFEFPGIGLTAQ